MKKLIRILAFTAMLAMASSIMTACGEDEESSTAVKTTTATTKAAESSKEESSESKAEASADANTETKYWTANIPAALTENADEAMEGDVTSFHIYEKKEGDEVVCSFEVYVYEEDSLSFREHIVSDELTLRDYADGKAETVSIGGADFIQTSSESDGDYSSKYYSRAEKAGLTASITIVGETNENIKPILDSIQFTFPDNGCKESPFPWDGEPFVATTGSAKAGSYDVKVTQVLLSESFLPDNIFDNKVVAVGDLVYVLEHKDLCTYKLNGDKMELQEAIELESEYKIMSADSNGNVYLSNFMDPTLVYKDGKLSKTLQVEDQLAISPDGKWGITYFTDTEKLEKVTISDDGAVSTEAFTIDANVVDMVNELFITNDSVIIAGSAADDSGHKVFEFDMDGKLLKTLTDEEGGGLGSITTMDKTANGYIGFDGNLRDLVLWNSEGKVLSALDCNELFGTNYPWPSGMCKIADGSYLVSMVEERPDNSADELVVYRVDTNF